MTGGRISNKCISNLNVQYQPIDRLVPFSNNARSHSKHQIRQIAASIEQFGFTNPVLIDQKNTIIAGHGRVAAATLLGMQNVPTIRLEGLNEDEIRAYILADNRIAEKAGWDKSILAIELQHLLDVDLDFDVTITGFEIPEIDLIFAETAQKPEQEDVVEISGTSQTVTQPGDLWLLGKHRLVCGNSLEAETFKALMNNRKAEAVFVDPPYNVRIEGNVSGQGLVKHGDFAMACGEMDQVEFAAFLLRSLTLLSRHSSRGSIHFVCMDWRHAGELIEAGKQTYQALFNLCVWVKDNGGQGSFYRSRHELVFVFKNGKGNHRNNVMLGQFGRYRTNVWEYPSAISFSKQSDEGNLLSSHPTVKPVALVADAILDCSKRGDLVLDSFLGSGTTLIAAERVGRTCYGIEIDPNYVDVAVRRWQRHTGDSAIHEGSGKRFDDVVSGREHGQS
jgi:DNA modification methylase